MNLEPEKIALRSQKFYDQANIEFLLQKQADHVDPKQQIVTFHNGEKIKYDKLLVATG